VNRRQFSVSVTMLAAFPLPLDAGFDDVDRALAFDVELQRLFSSPHDAVEVGRRYLQAHPQKPDRRVLIDDLLRASSSRDARPSSLAHLVSQWQERDFRDGAVVELDGWILARTEVSLCALLWLNGRT
jgi:hypothetical protein